MVRPFDKLRDRRLTNQAQDIAGSGIAGVCLYFTAGGWGTRSLALPLVPEPVEGEGEGFVLYGE